VAHTLAFGVLILHWSMAEHVFCSMHLAEADDDAAEETLDDQAFSHSLTLSPNTVSLYLSLSPSLTLSLSLSRTRPSTLNLRTYTLNP
jgi:hypothetical protein